MPSIITPSVSLEVIAISLIEEELEMNRLEEVVSVLNKILVYNENKKIRNIEYCFYSNDK